MRNVSSRGEIIQKFLYGRIFSDNVKNRPRSERQFLLHAVDIARQKRLENIIY